MTDLYKFIEVFEKIEIEYNLLHRMGEHGKDLNFTDVLEVKTNEKVYEICFKKGSYVKIIA